MLFSASLKHSIIVFESVISNSLNHSWKEKFKVFASVKEATPKHIKYLENINFGNIISETYFIFTIRFKEGLSKGMKISFNARDFLIKKIINLDQKNKVLEILALEI